MRLTTAIMHLFSAFVIQTQSTTATTCAHPLAPTSPLPQQSPSPPTSSPIPAQQITSRAAERCTNLLQNPSFESGTLTPWSIYATGSWSSRSITTGATHAGNKFFAAQSNSTNESTITLSQAVNLPTGSAVVDCAAWVRATGSARFEVFVGGVSCGARVLRGTGQWVEVGGRGGMVVGGGMQQIVVVGVVDGEMEVGVDAVWVGEGC